MADFFFSVKLDTLIKIFNSKVCTLALRKHLLVYAIFTVHPFPACFTFQLCNMFVCIVEDMQMFLYHIFLTFNRIWFKLHCVSVETKHY